MARDTHVRRMLASVEKVYGQLGLQLWRGLGLDRADCTLHTHTEQGKTAGGYYGDQEIPLQGRAHSLWPR